MKHITSITSLFLLCGSIAACDQKPSPAHENTSPLERSLSNPTDASNQGEPGIAPADGTIGQSSAQKEKPSDDDRREAEADLKPAEGVKLKGDVELKESAEGVEIFAEIKDATPGLHGFHIHEKGDCSDIPGKSMGAHFNPDAKLHRLPGEGSERHLGDLGNVTVGDDGKGQSKFTVTGASLKEGDSHSLLGKSFVVHASQDMGQGQQPAGDSGQPVACGIIEKD